MPHARRNSSNSATGRAADLRRLGADDGIRTRDPHLGKVSRPNPLTRAFPVGVLLSCGDGLSVGRRWSGCHGAFASFCPHAAPTDPLSAARAALTARRHVARPGDSFDPMEGDDARRHLSWRDLAAREEAALAFPGSRLVDERGYDEGEGWGFDDLQKSAMLQREYLVDADGDDVHDWFRTQLAARGWELGTSHNLKRDRIGADFHARGSESLILRVIGREDDRPASSMWPRHLRGEKGLLYDITFSDGETPVG